MLQLLRTKISPPPSRPRQIERARLLHRVDEGVLRALTLVVAPAGFGKTTLVATWAQAASISTAWLSLDANDRSPERFLTYLVQALQQFSPKIGQTALALLHSGHSVTQEGVLYSLIDDLADVPVDFALILDDYHVTENPQIDKILQFLLENRPVNFHVVLTTRNTPSFSLARLRALDQVTEISTDDLRFTDDEILTFLDECMEIELNRSELDHLKESTEGWAVGLQLVALALTRKAANWQIPAQNAHIFDYLVQEVFEREPAHVQDFLLHISLFDRFCTPLCEALLDGEPCIEQSVPELLAYIERANLFLFPLDTDGNWYRFHTLFADFLRRQFIQQHPEHIPDLYRKASYWFETQGVLDDAVHYAIHAQDFERAADLLETHYREIIQGSQQIMLLEWLSEIPIGQLDRRPILWLIKGWASVVSLETAQARICAERFENSTPIKEMTNNQRGELKALQILTSIFEGKSSTTDEISEAFALLSEQDDFLHMLLHLNVGMLSLLNGDTQQTIEAFNEVLALTQAFDNPLIITITGTHLGETYTTRGEFAQAEDAFRRTIRYIQETFGEKSFLLALPMISYAELLREQNRFTEARQFAEKGLIYSRFWQAPASLDAKVVLARIEAANGDWGQAYTYLESAIQTAESSETVLDDLLAAIHLIRLYLLQGDISQALYWSKFYHIETRAGQMPYYMQELGQLAHLRMEILSTDYDPNGVERLAQDLLPLIEKARHRGSKTATIEARILSAYALNQARKPNEALQALHQALKLGVESGYVRIFADEGPRLRQLLEHFRVQLSDVGPYLEMLLTIRGADSLHQVPAPYENMIPLTRRELDVLHQLAAGKTNQEIADGLVLALNTVKKHVANILGKLGVANRTQAVMLAREKGWLK